MGPKRREGWGQGVVGWLVAIDQSCAWFLGSSLFARNVTVAKSKPNHSYESVCVCVRHREHIEMHLVTANCRSKSLKRRKSDTDKVKEGVVCVSPVKVLMERLFPQVDCSCQQEGWICLSMWMWVLMGICDCVNQGLCVFPYVCVWERACRQNSDAKWCGPFSSCCLKNLPCKD